MMIRGKNLKAIAHDIADGIISVNPLFLKPLDADMLKALHRALIEVQKEIRREKFPRSDPAAIRRRNMRLQKLNGSTNVLKAYAMRHKIHMV